MKVKTYQTYHLKLTAELRARLPELTGGSGGYQSTFDRLGGNIKSVNSEFVLTIAEEDLKRLKKWALRADNGSWQEWARDVLKHNSMQASV